MEIGILLGFGLSFLGIYFFNKAKKIFKPKTKSKPVELVMRERQPDGSFKEHIRKSNKRKR